MLPSEARAREMTDSDYLYCLVHLQLDGEEALEGRCPVCGAPPESCEVVDVTIYEQ